MSDKVLLNSLADENRAIADKMLNAEAERQRRLKVQLSADPETAPWVEEQHLFQNYKQLQFFDTLALYFNCVQESERQEACFSHIPISATEDTNVDIQPLADGVYALTPYPFDHDGLDLTFEGRYLAPVDAGEDVLEALGSTPIETQSLRLVDAS